MNAAYLLTPRSEVGCIYDDHTLRQGLEKLRRSGYAALPVVTRQNRYIGTVSEGDFLWHLLGDMDGSLSAKELESRPVRDIIRIDRNPPVRITANVDELLQRATSQNFIPVIDDLGSFIGIVTRRDIIQHLIKKQDKGEGQPWHGVG